MNICTKFGADWKILRYRKDDTTSVTHTKWSQNHRHISYWSIRFSGCLKSPEKSLSSISENNIVCSETVILTLQTPMTV